MYEFLSDLKNRLVVFAGAILLLVVGRQMFYRLTQANSTWLSALPRMFCGSRHVQRLIRDFEVQIEGAGKDRISAEALILYSDDSLHGYGDAEFKLTDGKPLLEQQRGLIIPLVQKEIEAFTERTGTSPRVLEVGAANGDVIAYMAEKFPNVDFVGIDLSVANALNKHQYNNLRFIKGYSLDMFDESPEDIKCDIVFGTSTFVVQTPREFKRHIENFSNNGVSSFVFSDPVQMGMKQTNDDREISKHMGHYMWFHNYAGYLRRAGYEISYFDVRDFAYSGNPIGKVALVAGRLTEITC